MKDDIVERLRNWSARWDEPPYDLMEEAAVEIERLRRFIEDAADNARALLD